MSSLIDSIGLLCIAINGGKDNKVIGRTRLQKMIYFSKYLGWDVGEYKLHYYGPFSFGTAYNLKVATNSNFIQEHDGKPYTYNLTEEGNAFLEEFKSKICDTKKIQKTERLIKYLSEWSRSELELASTADYLQRLYPEIGKKQLLLKVMTVKSNHSEDAVSNAYNKLKKLKSLMRIA